MRFSLLSLAALPLAAQALEFLDDTLDILNDNVGDILDQNTFVEQDGLLKFPITVAKGAISKHHKRQATADLANRQTGFFYTIELIMGTPGRPVNVNFDTGSAELWVNPNCAKAQDPDYCRSFGLFGESSSFKDLEQNNTLKYGRGDANIEYGYDFVTVGSAKINQQVFGVAQDSSFHTTGILGAGPSLSGFDSPYPYVIDNLFKQNYIKSRTFSLDLRHIGSDRGAVVFGGMDTKKFSGRLEKRSIIPAAQSPDGQTRYWIYLDGITVTKDDGSETEIFNKPNGQAVFLDTGYTVSALPSVHFQKILKAFPSAKLDSHGQYTVDCSIVKSVKGSVNYKFGETVIKVPYSDFVWQQPDQGICILGVIEDDAEPVLGDTFLRAAYAVFDWDNEEIHIGKSADCGSSLIPIGSGRNAVPNVEGDCGKPEPALPLPHPIPEGPGAKGEKNKDSLNGTHPANATASSMPTHANATGKHPKATGFHNATTALPVVTSTIRETRVYTVTSCAPTITNCPVGHRTTQVVTRYTTFCPLANQTYPATTSTSRESCSQVTATIVLPKTIYCQKGDANCKPGQPVVTSCPATIQPITPGASATQIPGCTNCAAPSSTASAPVQPTNPAPAITSPPVLTTMETQAPVVPCTTCVVASQPPLTAGAGKFLPGAAAIAAAAIIAAL
ncbi:hypothetical protein VHEMI00944 [[Torrubiella] hemipterigena]|uniref:Peptidase A1 domain-containing protein n=1 Tax=[Torrubiella] hemipterigena TaxID=1531966 RepID=A0A0A1T614_9HYPO|nr:hypothetical protein VHEMI00944 [[Torrubiella] hemipterigena]